MMAAACGVLRVALRIAALAVMSLELASCRVAPGLTLYVFDCGYIRLLDVSVFSPGQGEGQPKDVVDSCYLVRHRKGTLLWDAGLPDSLVAFPDGVAVERLLHLWVRRTLASQLQKIGIAPDDITYVAFSHMHFDHVGNANAFAKATWLVQEAEYEVAFAAGADTTYYHRLRFGSVRLLHGDHDVFGDGSVVILAAPGHTPGHQVLFVDLRDSGPLVLSGDLYHFTDNRVHRRVPTFNFDRAQTLASMARIEAFLADRNATLWIQHDLEQNASIPHAPAFVQ